MKEDYELHLQEKLNEIANLERTILKLQNTIAEKESLIPDQPESYYIGELESKNKKIEDIQETLLQKESLVDSMQIQQ